MPRTAQRRRPRPAERGTAVPMWVLLVIVGAVGVITVVGCVG